MPSDPFRAIAERDALLGGLAALDPDERVVIVLHYWADLSLDQIAARIGAPLGTVKSHLHRARRRLERARKHGIDNRHAHRGRPHRPGAQRMSDGWTSSSTTGCATPPRHQPAASSGLPSRRSRRSAADGGWNDHSIRAPLDRRGRPRGRLGRVASRWCGRSAWAAWARRKRDANAEPIGIGIAEPDAFAVVGDVRRPEPGTDSREARGRHPGTERIDVWGYYSGIPFPDVPRTAGRESPRTMS